MNSLFKAVILASALAFAGGQAASALDLEHHVKHKHAKHAHAKHKHTQHKHAHAEHLKKHAKKPS